MKDIRKLVRANIAALTPYSTARDEYKGSLGILLDANENPYDAPYSDEGSESGSSYVINRYPSTSLKEAVREKVAALKGVAPADIACAKTQFQPFHTLLAGSVCEGLRL